jgi:hypothetical protein
MSLLSLVAEIGEQFVLSEMGEVHRAAADLNLVGDAGTANAWIDIESSAEQHSSADLLRSGGSYL